MQGNPRWTDHGGQFWQNMAHWRREWQNTPVFLPWVPHEQYEKAKIWHQKITNLKQQQHSDFSVYTVSFKIRKFGQIPNDIPFQFWASAIQWLSSVQSLSYVWLFATLWTVACQASLSNTNSQSFLKVTFGELVMLSNDLILCHPLHLPPSIYPRIRVF